MPDFSALPALAIKSFNVLDTLDAANDYKTKQALAPLAMQEATDEAGVRHTQYGNSMLAQAADEALASDPDKAPAAWDASMNKLADQGFGIARQYVGRYDKDTATKVRNTFGGRTGGAASAADQKIEAQQEQQAQQVVSQMPVEQASKSLANLNMGKEILRGVNSGESFVAAMDKARKAGLPVDKILAGRDLNNTSPLGWQSNYAAVQRFLDDREPMRKALEQRVGNEAMGIPNALPPNPKVVGNYVVDMNNPSKAMFSPPGKRTLVKPEDTGMAPGTIGEEGDYKPLVPEAATTASPAATQTAFAQKLNGSESSGNPAAQSKTSSSGGINGMVDDTYVSNARKLMPALKNVPKDQILAMKKSGPLNGLNTDMTISQNQDDAAVLDKNKLPVNNASVALMYKLGSADGMKVMRAINAAPDTPMSKLLSPAVLKANPDFEKQTAGGYAAGLVKQFGADPYGQSTQGQPSTKYGKFDEPKQLEYTDKDGNPVQVLAQQNKINGQWVTADSNRTPINAPNGDAKIIPAATGGGRVAMMITRSLTDAKDAAAEMDNITRLPISANAGLFGMRAAHGDGTLIGSAYNILGNKLTSQESQDINATMVGMGKALAGLQTGGTAGAGGKALMDQYEKLNIQQGDTYTTALRKIASMRQSALNAIEANMSGSFVNPAQKKEFQAAEDMIKKAVPWTPNDITNFERAGKKNPELTFQEFAANKGIAGVPQAKYHMGDIVKGYRFKGGDWQKQSNWEKATNG